MRFFIAQKKVQILWWFGGGFDLTPYYPFEEDVREWHQTSKDICAPFGMRFIPSIRNGAMSISSCRIVMKPAVWADCFR